MRCVQPRVKAKFRALYDEEKQASSWASHTGDKCERRPLRVDEFGSVAQLVRAHP